MSGKGTIEDTTEMVKVNVGLMEFNGEELRPMRGKGLLVQVRKDCGKEELLQSALMKHKAHSQNVGLFKTNISFVLCYHDGIEVEKLREKDEDFVLHKYKSECGKPYNRINFFLCGALVFSQKILGECINPLTSDNDTSYSSDESDNVKSKRPKVSLSSSLFEPSIPGPSTSYPANEDDKDLEITYHSGKYL